MKRTEPVAGSPESTKSTRKHGRGTVVPNPIDVHVGGRMRMRRLLLGMNQETFANALGLTLQQVEKYEGGANRVSASRLSAMAEILGVPISYFFADLRPDDAEISPVKRERRERLPRPEEAKVARGKGQPSKEERATAAAFAAAAAELLNAVNGALVEVRQGRKETRLLLDHLEALLAPSHR